MVGQLSKDITLDTVNFRVRPESGRTTAGFADFVQMSSIGGKVTMRNCDFSVAHDDPINIHGTFLSVESVSGDGRTLTLKYNHHETAGFPQYYEGDQVDFSTHSTMVPVADSLRTVEKVIDNGWGKDTMQIRLDRPVPQLSDGGRYVIENVTYTPEVEITGCRFANIPTRGILVTTRKPVLIENNYFDAMNMASIFISCDAQEWYESGHTEKVVIRNNVFDRPGSEGILVGPTGRNDRSHQLHSNMIIEDNIFNLDKSVQIVNAKSVKDLVIRNNVVNRYKSDMELAISANKSELRAGETLPLSTEITGADKMPSQLYRFENCTNVTVADNTYDAGLNQKIEVTDGTTDKDINIVNDNLKIGQDNNTDPKGQLYYFSSNPNVLTVSNTGEINAVAAGNAEVHAFSVCGARVYESNVLEFTVTGDTVPTGNVKLSSSKTLLNVGDTQQIDADSEVSWSVKGDAVEIDNAGVVTAKKSGVAEVIATAADGRVGSILIAVQLSQGTKSNDWTVNRDAKNWTIDPKTDTLTINAKPGGDWDASNQASSIFLTSPKNSNNFTATVKLHNKTVSGYEEAGLVAFADSDNYIAIQRKHADGKPNISVSKETAGKPTETTKTYTFSDDCVWFRIKKNNDKVVCEFSGNGKDQWQTFDEVTSGPDLSNCQVGIIACNSKENTPFTFSDFTLDGAGVPFALPVVAPTISNAVVSHDSTSATVTYNFAASNGTAEGNSVYRWYLSSNGTVRSIKDATQKTISLKPEYSNCELQAAVIPVDANGCVGEPVMTDPVKVSEIAADPKDTSLATVNLGTTPIFDPATKTYKLTLPMSIDTLPVVIKASNPDATVSVTMDGNTIIDSVSLTKENHRLTVNVTATNASEIYTIEVIRRKNSLAALDMMTLGDLKFDPDVHFYQLIVGENQKNATLSLEAAAGTLRVSLNNALLAENEQIINNLRMSCADGLNTLEIKVIAEDGVSTATYRVVIIGSLESQNGNGGGGSGGNPVKPITPEPPKPEKPDIDIIPVVPGNPETIKPFTDTNGHWAQDAIAWAVTNNLFTGVSTSQFAPNTPMTRGMLVTVLHRLAGRPVVGQNQFADVVADAYYEDAVAWASNLGLVSGVGNGKFAPNNNVTREQLAVILYKFAGSPVVSDLSVSFADSTAVSSWAQDAIVWAVNEGLLAGMSDGSLAPRGQATRAQVATILMRFTSTLD